MEQNEDRFISAAQEGDVQALKALLEAGVNVNAKGSSGMTALMHAARMNDVPFASENFIETLADERALDWLFGIFSLSFYYFIFEVAFQRTPAKFITRTKVVTLDGAKPDAAAIAVRTLTRFVPFEPFSGVLDSWWHDRWSKTEVVEA